MIALAVTVEPKDFFTCEPSYQKKGCPECQQDVRVTAIRTAKEQDIRIRLYGQLLLGNRYTGIRTAKEEYTGILI